MGGPGRPWAACSRYLIGSRDLPNNTVLNARDVNARDRFGDVGPLPLWLAVDYIGSGDQRSKAALSKITDWLKSKTGAIPRRSSTATGSMATTSVARGRWPSWPPSAPSPPFDAGNQAWLDAIWKLKATAPTTSEPADTANVLGMLLVTGNWWQP